MKKILNIMWKAFKADIANAGKTGLTSCTGCIPTWALGLK